ncbi:hypothetical protein [Amycolatopsis sp. YIM 10]|uniref:hypothetical protein n=1 Tax=Amycolatopsis sp. YIM 10 TaxID=2653857 RepID=UPI0012900518|nr:hypothetical protein [Amycolatopsis sp. YIM 10]QFU92393.1 hypothetical protein YIM_36170 [Amycolatopsis sp. YIM 10]
MSGNDWAELAGVIGIFILITTVLTVAIWQLAVSWRAKAALSREETYRDLAERAVRSQEETQRQLTELRSRVEGVERILKDVE